ncbi:hypothetical protein LAX5112_05028 [Roseibium alexandrii]|uniref:Uncharacterized protein n=1 Tax=Roseibium alexandrii TaxID=388408 RepID=A0A0M7AS44_9HYPH|nr:hypothetical protein LAX5112_05028 [Roseibium alexandrii]
MTVVIYLTARDEGLQIGGKALGAQAGHKASQIVGVGTNVSSRTPQSGPGRVRAPVGLLVVLFDRQPILRVFDLNDPDCSKIAVLDHLPRLTDHRIAGVIVRENKQGRRGLGRFGQLFGVCQRGGHRLVADHVNAAFQKRLGSRIVNMVRRHDGNRFDPVLQPCLPFGHVFKGAIDPIRLEAESLSGRDGLIRC